jgi:hypothetical protein
MKEQMDQRSFLRSAGMSLGIGVIYEFAPFLARRAETRAISDFFKQVNDEAPASFTIAGECKTHAAPDAKSTRLKLTKRPSATALKKDEQQLGLEGGGNFPLLATNNN